MFARGGFPFAFVRSAPAPKSGSAASPLTGSPALKKTHRSLSMTLLKTPNRKRQAVLAVLGLVAVGFAAWLLFGRPGSPAPRTASELEAARADSINRVKADIHLAVLSAEDALPFVAARELHLFEKHGVSVDVRLLAAQSSVDSAFRVGAAQLATADASALEAFARSGRSAVNLFPLSRRSELLSAAPLRLNKPKQLRRRTVAADRHGASGTVALGILRRAGISEADALIPNVEDVVVRASMLAEAQVDAAILPEPYLSQALAEGHRSMLKLSGENAAKPCVVASKPFATDKNGAALLERFSAAYNEAADSLNLRGAALTAPLLCRFFHMTETAAQAYKPMPFSHVTLK